jgi:integrase
MAKHRETGCLIERSPGHWAIVISVRDPASGKRKRQWHSFTGTKKEAQAERIRLLAAINAGTAIEPGKTKLAKYLDEWLQHVKPTVAPRTHERYAEIVAKYLVPTLGETVLTKLQPITVSTAYDKIKTSRTKGQGELSARTILHCHRVLSAALRQAVRWRLLPYNPAADVKPPKVERRKLTTYSLTQAVDVLEALRASWMHIPAMLGILCGMRRGEIAALRWGVVNLDKGQLAIVQSAEQTKAGVRYKEPKSGQVRTIALSPAVVAELRAHRARQAETLLRLGIRLDGDSFVVAQADGSPYDPDSISKEWRVRIIKSTLPRVRFHDLRHAHASHMLASGVHPKIASERLGHSRVGITLDLYSHVVEGLQENAVALVDDAMAKALQKRAAELG